MVLRFGKQPQFGMSAHNGYAGKFRVSATHVAQMA